MVDSFEKLLKEVKSLSAPEGIAGTISEIIRESVNNKMATGGKPMVNSRCNYFDLMLKLGMIDTRNGVRIDYSTPVETRLLTPEPKYWLLSEKAIQVYDEFHREGYYKNRQ